MAGPRAYVRVTGSLLAAALVVLSACGDDGGGTDAAGDTRADQVRDALAESGLAEDVVEVLALAAAGTDGTFRVAYELVATDGGTQRVELTQRPPDRRLEITDPDGTVDATIAVGGSFHQCQRDETWSCTEVGPTAAPTGGALDPDAVEQLATSLTEDVDRYDLSVEHREVAGVEATCLVAALRPGVDAAPDDGAEGTICVSPEGAVLLTERSSETLEAVDYSSDVDDDAFALPG